jgi:hypothetical protein
VPHPNLVLFDVREGTIAKTAPLSFFCVCHFYGTLSS